jgi:hypothetical protein
VKNTFSHVYDRGGGVLPARCEAHRRG